MPVSVKLSFLHLINPLIVILRDYYLLNYYYAAIFGVGFS